MAGFLESVERENSTDPFASMLGRISFVLYCALIPALCEVHSPSENHVDHKPSFPWNKMRLPETVKPLHYDLFIHPNLTYHNFSGIAQIQIEVQEETRAIILHSKDLLIVKATFLAPGHPRKLKVLDYPAFEQIAVISNDFTISKGVHVLSIEFTANLSESFHGFYKGSYNTKDGETR